MIIKAILRFLPVCPTLILFAAGCSTVVDGPSVMALPGSGSDFDRFRVDDSACRAYAYQQMGGVTASQAAVGTGLASAAIGTGLGAAVGGIANGGQGASVGAATGLAVGGLSGIGFGSAAGYAVQGRYDNAYVQCMYAKGHRVPVSADLIQAPTRDWYSPSVSQPPPDYLPPPPRGRPPAPPPDAY